MGAENPVAFQTVLCNGTDIAPGAVFENQAGYFAGAFFEMFYFRFRNERCPVNCHFRRKMSRLQVGAGTAVTTVTCFEQEQGCKKGESKKFLPIFHVR